MGVISGDWLPQGVDTEQVNTLIKDFQKVSGPDFICIIFVLSIS